MDFKMVTVGSKILAVCVAVGLCMAILLTQFLLNGNVNEDTTNIGEEFANYVIDVFNKKTSEDETDTIYAVSQNGYAISTSSYEATMVGVAVLEAGGNAVDAAIAVAYTLGVVEPYGSGLGGGGGMLIYDPTSDEYTFINYYSMSAPSGVTSKYIAVPGFVSGMETAYNLYATLDFADLLSYAIEYAEQGFEIGSELSYRISAYSTYLVGTPFSGLTAGDTVIQPELAATLKEIAENGSDSFYSGIIAESIIANTRLKSSDLTSYTTDIEAAITSEFAGYTIASAPAPFSGLTVIQMVKLFELLDVPDPDDDVSSYISNLIKIKTSADKDRYSYVFDGSTPDYQNLLTEEYLLSLVNGGGEVAYEDGESSDTTHFSIVDSNGMAVSCTNTLSSFWGSKVYISGFFMNNSVSNFSSSGSNAYAAGKRPRTGIAPTILTSDDGTVIALGSPGGRLIPSMITSVLTDVILYGEDPHSAVSKKRIYVSSSKNLLVETSTLSSDLIANVYNLGYTITESASSRKFGSVNIAMYTTDNGYNATSDPHRNAQGYASNVDTK